MSRYELLFGIGLLIAACGGHPPEPVQSHAAGSAAARGTGSAPVAAGSGAAATGPTAIADIGCSAPSCAYHAGAAAYFTCLSGGAGACFHFGGPCAPADGCMFDASARAYKQCANAVEGTCAQWGTAACAPASACMFDPDDGLHHHCDDVAGGSCRKYGALCKP